jgi:hypothetical protein
VLLIQSSSLGNVMVIVGVFYLNSLHQKGHSRMIAECDGKSDDLEKISRSIEESYTDQVSRHLSLPTDIKATIDLLYITIRT